MKNVLYIFSTLKKSGPINIIYNIYREIDRTKFNPIVLSLSKENKNEISAKQDINNLDIQIYSLNLDRVSGFFKGKRKIYEFCKKNHIETIHLIGFRADLIVRGKLFDEFNIVSSIFSNFFEDYSMLYGKIKGNMMAYLHLKSLEGKSKVACSDFVYNELKNWMKFNSYIIKNSVSKEFFFVASMDVKIAMREKLKIDLLKKVYIFVGVLIKRKDPVTTIQAFLNSNVCKRNEGILLVLGDGELRDKCSELSNYNNAIRFMGNTSETLSYLQASDFYISSSHSEGLPTSVVEALSCGLVPILSDIKSHKEIIYNFLGDNLLFPVKDVMGLTKLIDDVISEDYDTLSKQSRLIVEKELNSKIMTEKYQSLY